MLVGLAPRVLKCMDGWMDACMQPAVQEASSYLSPTPPSPPLPVPFAPQKTAPFSPAGLQLYDAYTCYHMHSLTHAFAAALQVFRAALAGGLPLFERLPAHQGTQPRGSCPGGHAGVARVPSACANTFRIFPLSLHPAAALRSLCRSPAQRGLGGSSSCSGGDRNKGTFTLR